MADPDRRLGLGPPGDALLETSGRRTGRPRLTPICDGQDGDTFWVVTQHGRRSDYVRNIKANPRVRVKVRRGLRTEWLAGTAHIVDDDPTERQRIMARACFWRRILRAGLRGDEHEPEAALPGFFKTRCHSTAPLDRFGPAWPLFNPSTKGRRRVDHTQNRPKEERCRRFPPSPVRLA
jgi:deazaflavin-dependent oxidoreductase (nitroreductase family)